MIRPLFVSIALLLLFAGGAVPAQQQPGGFDLDGPVLSITVMRDGMSLPITAVPSLRAGDRLTIRAVTGVDRSGRYMLIGTFLRGAASPPPEKWFAKVETWQTRKTILELTVPEGAEQALVMLAPQAGGGFDAVRDAVRGRPGVFVRAARDLHQASLDQARLETFISAVGAIADTQPDKLTTAAPSLAKAMGIRLNTECLSRPRAVQAACLTQNREALVLQAQRGTTLAETLTGTSVDVAYRIAATPEAGAGYYSPYIALARDLARLFGAFRSAQYQYLPALAVGRGDNLQLRLNAAPSFQNPRSVLLAPLPPIGAAPPPLWQPAKSSPICLARPDIAVPIENGSLLFATGYARDLKLSVTAGGRQHEIPIAVDVATAGLRLVGHEAIRAMGKIEGGTVTGKWGFDPFTGPRLPIVLDVPGAWRARPDKTVIVGREHSLTLEGGASACVAGVTLAEENGTPRPVAWQVDGPGTIETKLSLENVRPGEITLTVLRHGSAASQTLALAARAEASRLDRFVVHRGDRDGTLQGARLDQVARLDIAGFRFAPGAIVRGGDGDRMRMHNDKQVGTPDEASIPNATVTLRDGRTLKVKTTILPARPSIALISRQARYTPPGGTFPITVPDAILPERGTLAFSFRTVGGSIGNGIEIAARDGTATLLDIASGALQRVGDDVVIGTFSPVERFGRGQSGPVRFRISDADSPGEWQPLAHIVRLPELTRMECPAGAGECVLSGRGLFLIAAIAGSAEFMTATTVPVGFVGESLTVPRPAGNTLYLRLHDAPDAVVQVTLPAMN